MATGQTALDLMEVLDNELQLQSGEADVARGLVALNAAQDLFETVISRYQDLMENSTGTVTTSASTETTAFPSSLLRLDRLQMLDSNSKPIWTLRPLRQPGEHIYSRLWPSNITSVITTGRPTHYYTNGTSIYWAPEPDATYTVRWYGFAAAASITAVGTFAYPDFVLLPLATMAVKIMRLGVGDEAADVDAFATQVFAPVVATLQRFWRDRAPGLVYNRFHEV